MVIGGLKLYRLLLFLFLLTLLAGCSDQGNEAATNKMVSIENPKPVDYLSKENAADIFYWEGIVYANGSDLDWVQDTDYQIKEGAGEITNQTNEAEEFTDKSANILPIGTKIFVTDTSLLIAIVEGKEIPYIPMIEG